jgi:hypothetical protein
MSNVATEGVAIGVVAIATLNWWAALSLKRAVRNEIITLAAAAIA